MITICCKEARWERTLFFRRTRLWQGQARRYRRFYTNVTPASILTSTLWIIVRIDTFINSAMSFVFVENATIDRKTRRKIRSHVMQGKNAGRTIHRASRIHGHPRPSPAKTDERVTHKRSEHCPKKPRTGTSVVETPQKMLGHMFSGQIFPVTLSWENRRTIHQC